MGLLHFSGDWRWFRNHIIHTTNLVQISADLPSKRTANWGEVVERVAVDLKKLSSP